MHVVTADAVAALVSDGDTVVIGGSGSGHAVPEALIEAVERRFVADGAPRNITSLHPVGLGDRSHRGVARFAKPGLLKRIVCGTIVDAPAVAAMASANEIEAYTLPQGVLSQLMREIAAGRPGLLTHVGLHTFVDPRQAGGRQSACSVENLVEVVNLAGREWLFYKPFHIDIAFLRGTSADEDGNISMEDEAIFGEMLSMAQATRRCGGIVVVQVKRLAKRGALPGKTVKIPGLLVDLVVVDGDQMQTYQTRHDAAFAGDPVAKVRLGSDGKVLPGIEVEVRDEDGNVLAVGEPGLVFLRGEQVSGEYEGGSVVDAEGWFPTKDRGWIDQDDYLFIEGRADDTPEVIRRRLEVYDSQTAPLIDVYAARGLVAMIDGLGEIADVTARIIEALEARGLLADA